MELEFEWDEERFVLFGRSERDRTLAVIHAERGLRIRIISARPMTPRERREYAERYARGTNLMPLDPEVLEVFPDAESVNRALRALAGIIREQQSRKPAA